jgi:hypothetical protein
MLRRVINGEIAIGFSLATLFWIAVLASGTSYSLTNPEKEACYQAAAKSGRSTEECKSFWERTTNDPLAMFTLVLATSTVGLWCATIALYCASQRQFRQLRRSVDVAENSDEVLQRAYVWPGYGASYPIDDGKRRKWIIRVHNTGRTAGILQKIYFARPTMDEFKARKYVYEYYDGREDVIFSSNGTPIQVNTGLDFTIDGPTVCCGWIEYQDIFGKVRKQGWKHVLNLTADSAGNYSIPFPGCYSAAYKPWDEANLLTHRA